MNYWGKYFTSKYPKVEWDSLQSFVEADTIYGYRVHIIPLRSNRPRENKLPKSKKLADENTYSLLLEIAKGVEPSIPISGDKNVIGTPTADPKHHNLMNYSAITIINKYSPTKLYGGLAEGVAIISYPTERIVSLSNSKLNNALLVSLKTALLSLLGKNFGGKKLNSSLIFFNIGPSSGASLSQLHAQAYVMPKTQGLISFNFNKSFKAAFRRFNRCLTCDFANQSTLTDHLGQKIIVLPLIIIENLHARMIMSNAPIRPFSLRIIPKSHISYFAQSKSGLLKTISEYLSLGDQLISAVTSKSKVIRYDRTIAFRQSLTLQDDFHFFIDLMPSIPFGGAEMIDSLTISPFESSDIVQQMKKYFVSGSIKI